MAGQRKARRPGLERMMARCPPQVKNQRPESRESARAETQAWKTHGLGPRLTESLWLAVGGREKGETREGPTLADGPICAVLVVRVGKGGQQRELHYPGRLGGAESEGNLL